MFVLCNKCVVPVKNFHSIDAIKSPSQYLRYCTQRHSIFYCICGVEHLFKGPHHGKIVFSHFFYLKFHVVSQNLLQLKCNKLGCKTNQFPMCYFVMSQKQHIYAYSSAQPTVVQAWEAWFSYKQLRLLFQLGTKLGSQSKQHKKHSNITASVSF